MANKDTKENIVERLYRKGKKALKTPAGKIVAGIAGSAILCGATYLASQSNDEPEPKKNGIENVKQNKQEQTLDIIQITPNEKERKILRDILLKDSFELKVITRSQGGKQVETENYDKSKEYPQGSCAQIINKNKEIVAFLEFCTDRELKSTHKKEKKHNNGMTVTTTEEYSKPQFSPNHLVILDSKNPELRNAILACLPTNIIYRTDDKGNAIFQTYVGARDIKDFLPQNDPAGKNLKDFLIQAGVTGNINGLSLAKQGYTFYDRHRNIRYTEEFSYLGKTIKQFNEQQTKTKQLMVANKLSNGQEGL